MKVGEIDAASGGNSALRRSLTKLQTWATKMESQSGVDPLASLIGGRLGVAPPALSAFEVVGADGHFQVMITNPSGITGEVLHEVKTSPTVPLLRSTDVHTYGPSSSTFLDVLSPDTSLYFQLRSKFKTSAYNQPQVHGPVAAGSVIASLPVSLAQGPFAPTTPVMEQVDVTASIRVFPTVFNLGSKALGYLDGSITVDTDGNPLTFSTYYAFVYDPQKLGGVDLAAEDDSGDTNLYQAALTLDEVRADAGNLLLGAISLRAGGGGLTLAEGVEGGPAAGTLVTMADGTFKAVELLVAGDAVLGLDPAHPEVLASTPTILSFVNCFTITTNTGKTVTISSDHTLQLGSGSRVPVLDLVPGDSLSTSLGQEQVTSKVFAGILTVYQLPLDRNKFHLGGQIWCG